MQYDHVVFTTNPLNSTQIQELRNVVSPANLEVVLNSRPLEEEIAALPKPVLERLMKKCKVKSPEEIQWDIRCQEDRSFGRLFLPTTLKYRWQAEFRSSRLLQHEALRKYRYMF